MTCHISTDQAFQGELSATKSFPNGSVLPWLGRVKARQGGPLRNGVFIAWIEPSNSANSHRIVEILFDSDSTFKTCKKMAWGLWQDLSAIPLKTSPTSLAVGSSR